MYTWRNKASFQIRPEDAETMSLIGTRESVALQMEGRDVTIDWELMYRSHWFQTLVYQLEAVNSDIAEVLCDEVLKNMCILEYN